MKKQLLFITLSIFTFLSQAQFYTGFEQNFGKNRVQFDEFLWNYYEFDGYNVYFNTGGKEVAIYTARALQETLREYEEKYNFYLDDKVHFVVYNKIEHLRQSNIGLKEENAEETGGMSHIVDSKVFLYFNGDHKDLERQIKVGLTTIMTNRMVYGASWKEMIKSSAFLTLPDWYLNGLVSFLSNPKDLAVNDFAKDYLAAKKTPRINFLDNNEATMAGHMIWEYISETYGQEVIPNILYMTRISRNIESGFLFVLGSSLNTVLADSKAYFATKFGFDSNQEISEELPIKSRKNRVYYDAERSTDNRYLAYATNEKGQIKIWIYDTETEKTEKIFKFGYKLERINNYSYPILAWHPQNNSLTFFYENKGTLLMNFYDLETKKTISKEVFKLEKIYDASYSKNGKKMLFSAVKEGKTDIYEYNVLSNTSTNLTNDIYDDKNPIYLPGEKEIIFSSNRSNDTLKNEQAIDISSIENNYDLFVYSKGNGKILKRATNTPEFNEQKLDIIDKDNFSYLSDEFDIQTLKSAHFDSTISHIDTAFHYRYFTESEALYGYNRNIIDYDINSETHFDLIKQGKHKFYIQNNDKSESNMTPSIKEEAKGRKSKQEKETKTEIKTSSNIEFQLVDNNTSKENDGSIDVENYTFEDDKISNSQSAIQDTAKRFVTLEHNTDTTNKELDFYLPKQLDYDMGFVYSDWKTDMNFAYESETYQYFNGGPYIRPGIGMTSKIELNNIFEDYKVTAGFRYGFNRSSTEYFMQLLDRKKRIDKLYEVGYQNLIYNDFVKINTAQVKAKFSYAVSEVARFDVSIKPRFDKFIYNSITRQSIEQPNVTIAWLNAKAEFVFDNTLSKGLNMYNGTRGKVFFEAFNNYYEQIGGTYDFEMAPAPEIYIAGVDFRNYQKITNDLILASRFAASTSVGENKLIYYMGGVDGVLARNDADLFNNETPIDYSQNYAFQTVATNMRGFLQNTRNGNNFALINNEIRFRFLKYIYKRPLKSEFAKNLQFQLFNDIGTAWNGRTPYSDDNALNRQVVADGPIKVILENRNEPIISSFGWGIRSMVLGYYLKADIAYPIMDYEVLNPVLQLSVGTDF